MNKRRITTLLSLCLLAGLTACSNQEHIAPSFETQLEQVTASTSSTEKDLSNGIWVNLSKKQLSSKHTTEDMINELNEDGITNLYVSFDKEDGLEEHYVYLNQLAHENNMRVFATMGHPQWAVRGELGLEHIEAVAQYNTAKDTGGHFDGVMLEVDPYENANNERDWENRTGLLDEWLHNSYLWKEYVQENGLLLYGSFPQWLDKSAYINDYYSSPNNRPFYENMLAIYDGYAITIQSNNIDEIIGYSLEEIKTADRLNKDVFIRLETDKGSSYLLNYYSFNGWTKEDFNLLSELLEEQFQTHTSYKGIGIHTYAGWSEMKEK